MHSCRAFTLLEAMATLAIMGLAAGLVGVSLHGALANVRFDEVVQRIGEYDRGTRLLAQNQARAVALAFDDQAIRTVDLDGDELEPAREAMHLPGDYSIEDVFLPEGLRHIAIGPEGRGRSYGLRLVGPRGQRVWLWVTGATGALVIHEAEAAFERVWAPVRDGRVEVGLHREAP